MLSPADRCPCPKSTDKNPPNPPDTQMATGSSQEINRDWLVMLSMARSLVTQDLKIIRVNNISLCHTHRHPQTQTHMSLKKKRSADSSAPAAQHVCGADKEQERRPSLFVKLFCCRTFIFLKRIHSSACDH